MKEARHTVSILVVDDDPLFRGLIARMLGGLANVSHLEASGVAEASALLRQHRPTILLTDLQMADGDGVDLLEALPNLSPGTMPLLMSGVASLRDYQSALRLGAVDVLTKPFTKDELLLALRRAVDSSSGFRGLVHGLLLTDLLQMLHLAGRSVILEVRGPHSQGELAFQGGELIHAQVGPRQGLDALQELVALQAGTIHTHPFREAPRTIEGSFQEVLMDAFREVDEAQREALAPLSSPGGEAPAAAEIHTGLRVFLRELDPGMGLGRRVGDSFEVLEHGGLPPERWERLAALAAVVLQQAQLHWTQIQWTIGTFGAALVRGGPDVFLVAQKFGGKLDDRRFRWNIARIERFCGEGSGPRVQPPTSKALPTMDALQVCREAVKAHDRNLGCAVVSLESGQELAKYLRAPAQDHLLQSFLAVVLTLLRDQDPSAAPPSASRATPRDVHLTGEVLGYARLLPASRVVLALITAPSHNVGLGWATLSVAASQLDHDP